MTTSVPVPLVDALRPEILPLRARAEIRNGWLRERLETVLPELMARTGFDMWLVIAREYNEDPVILTLLPEPSMAARRRTMLVFTRQPDGTVERLSIDRYGFGEFYSRAWDPDTGEEQYACLTRIIRERNPQRIGVNVSPTFAFGDGLTHQEYERLATAIGDELIERVHSADRLCVGWLERRIPAELSSYPHFVEIGHRIIAEAFSRNVIEPGATTTDDVVWWFRQTMLDLGVQAWFQPSVSIQANGHPFDIKEGRRTLIQPGDLLHCDVGFYYLGLATDQQQHAYVLRPGETDAPRGLKDALAAGNRLQDILISAIAVGKTGNQILRDSLAQARSEGIEPSIYTHPLGYHGHAAGPTIGLWDRQEGVPGPGDYEVFDNTCYSIELNAKYPVPEWNGQKVQIALEEDAVLTSGRIAWLSGRQTKLHLI
ncbi:MAG: M24 family metallopeptidase [Roseiflexaceae bacterium]|nr:M24 family metallopeptidase [Roseiflexaceae bacterium]